ncbi:DUF2157 domain-containing protein [Algiphilus sp.]|uniref:DUF2157 domain-containing protein n=1 Tax=Algiphilus sp. TaxID=1872431 RepID=UPI003B5157E1
MKRGPAWLQQELPQMQAEGVIDAEVAERLRAYCAAHSPSPRRWIWPLLGALGALLVGFGVVLLLAHNWDGLSRGMRILIAFTPLAVGQVACVWALVRAPFAEPWREAAGAFTALAFAAALALVGQIYHLGGELDRYLLSCALVAIPLAYVLRAFSVLLLSAAALLGWTVAAEGVAPLAVVAAFISLLPLIAFRFQAGQRRAAALTLSLWVPTAIAAVGISLAGLAGREAALLWLVLGVGIVWLARDAEGRAPLAPLRSLAQAGLIVMAAAATFEDFWQGRSGGLNALESPAATGLLLMAALAFGALLVRAVRALHLLLAAGAVPVIFVGMALLLPASAMPALVAMSLANAYVLGMGVTLLHFGLRLGQLGMAHAGLVTVALLVLVRFLDADLPFSLRGLAFVVTGIGFIGASLWLRRRAVRA